MREAPQRMLEGPQLRRMPRASPAEDGPGETKPYLLRVGCTAQAGDGSPGCEVVFLVVSLIAIRLRPNAR